MAQRASAEASREADKAAFRAGGGTKDPPERQGRETTTTRRRHYKKNYYYRSLFVRSSVGTKRSSAVG